MSGCSRERKGREGRRERGERSRRKERERRRQAERERGRERGQRGERKREVPGLGGRSRLAGASSPLRGAPISLLVAAPPEPSPVGAWGGRAVDSLALVVVILIHTEKSRLYIVSGPGLCSCPWKSPLGRPLQPVQGVRVSAVGVRR